MSRQIDYSQPVTGADRDWALQFPGLHGALVEASDSIHGKPEDETLEGAVVQDNYDELNVAELVAELKRRNDEEGTSLSTTGKKPELIARLRADDEARG